MGTEKSFIQYFHTNNVPGRIQTLLKPVENFAGSFGLQPFRIIVTSNKKLPASEFRQDAAGNQESWLLIFAVRNQITSSDIDDFIDDIRENKKYPAASLNRYRKTFEDSINKKNDSGDNWAERQARSGIAILLASAQQVKIDVRVDEIIDHSAFDDVLNNINKGYISKFSVQLTWNKNDKFIQIDSKENSTLIGYQN